MAMRSLLLASIVTLALGAVADSARGDWRTFGTARGDWRTYGTANKVSSNGVWQRGYGRMGYGWYSVYGDYVGNDYSWYSYYPYRSPSSGFNFNRTDNYGWSDPRYLGNRPR